MAMMIEPGDIVIDNDHALGPCGVAMSGIYSTRVNMPAVDVKWLFSNHPELSAWTMALRAIKLYCPADKL